MPFIDNEESIGQFSGLVSQISEYDTRFMSTLNNRESTDIGKGLLAQAITANGIACSAGDTFEQMCAKIAQLSGIYYATGTLNGNTTAEQVVECGFKPDYIFVVNYGNISSNGNTYKYIYTKGNGVYQYHTNAAAVFNGFVITPTGFKFTGYAGSVNPVTYYAIGKKGSLKDLSYASAINKSVARLGLRMSAASYAKVLNVEVDTDFFSLSSDVYTCKIAGNYKFYIYMVSGSTTGCRYKLYKNGVVVNTPVGTYWDNYTHVLSLNVGDTWYLEMTCDSAGTGMGCSAQVLLVN